MDNKNIELLRLQEQVKLLQRENNMIKLQNLRLQQQNTELANEVSLTLTELVSLSTKVQVRDDE